MCAPLGSVCLATRLSACVSVNMRLSTYMSEREVEDICG